MADGHIILGIWNASCQLGRNVIGMPMEGRLYAAGMPVGGASAALKFLEDGKGSG